MYVILHGILYCSFFFLSVCLFTILRFFFIALSLSLSYFTFNIIFIMFLYIQYGIFLKKPLKFFIQTYTIDHIHLYTKRRRNVRLFVLLIIIINCFSLLLILCSMTSFFVQKNWALAVGHFRHLPRLFFV